MYSEGRGLHQRIRFARSATKHGIARSRTRYVIEHAGMRFHVPAPDAAGDGRLLYTGDDQHGTPREVIAVELGPGEVLVIHSMHLRRKYLSRYREASPWRV